MNFLVCKMTMRPCQTESMCSPYQGCGEPQPSITRTAEQVKVPEGWKLVPIEPTIEMCQAVNKEWVINSEHILWAAIIYEAYRTILAAAPTPPAEQGGI